MSFFSLFSFGVRSRVHVTEAFFTVDLPLKDTDQSISLSSLIKKSIPELDDGAAFWQAPSLGNGHLQTLYAALGDFESVDKIYYGRRLITFEDGASVSADYVVDPPKSKEEWKKSLVYSPVPDPPPYPARTRYLTTTEIEKLHLAEDQSRPLVISLHGLSGGSHESYVRAAITAMSDIHDGNFDCVVLNSRGCARTKITTPQLFCALMTDDIRRYVKMIRKTQPNRHIYLVGYSLGASILANYIGQEGDKSTITAAICIANPWDLNQSNYTINGTVIGRHVYSPAMAKNLMKLLKNHRKMLETNDVFVKGEKQRINLIRDFDNAFTAPAFGFATAQDYYRSASPVNRLMNNRTPLLILNALDDPIADPTSLPYDEVRANPYTFMATTDLGGHLGWFLPGSGRWFPPLIAKFFEAFEQNIAVEEKDRIVSHLNTPVRLYDRDRLHLSPESN